MKYYMVDIEFLLESATSTMFCGWDGAGNYIYMRNLYVISF